MPYLLLADPTVRGTATSRILVATTGRHLSMVSLPLAAAQSPSWWRCRLQGRISDSPCSSQVCLQARAVRSRTWRPCSWVRHRQWHSFSLQDLAHRSRAREVRHQGGVRHRALGADAWEWSPEVYGIPPIHCMRAGAWTNTLLLHLRPYHSRHHEHAPLVLLLHPLLSPLLFLGYRLFVLLDPFGPISKVNCLLLNVSR